MAKLYYRYSAMNSGKTTALVQAAYNYEERGMKVVLLKPSIDTKGGQKVVSRLGIGRKVDILVGKADSVAQLLADYGSVACVLVDEAHFLEPSQVEDLFWYAVRHDTPVLAFGLRTDFQTVGFPGASRMLELAHDLQELKTICRCGRKAILNARKRNGTFIFSGDQVAIDGEASIDYESLCASCYSDFEQASRN